MRNSNSLAVPECSIDENSHWNKGTGEQQRWGKGIFLPHRRTDESTIQNICKLRVERPLPLHRSSIMRFPSAYDTIKAQRTSCVAHCPLAEVLSFKKTKTCNSYIFTQIIPNPMCLRCNAILLHHGDKDAHTPTFSFVSRQSIKASFEQSHLVQDNAIGQHRFEPPWGGWEGSKLLLKALIHGHSWKSGHYNRLLSPLSLRVITYPGNPCGFGMKIFRHACPWSLSRAHASTMCYSPFLAAPPDEPQSSREVPHSVYCPHGPWKAILCRYSSVVQKLQGKSTESLFQAFCFRVSPFPILSWVGGDTGRQSVCRTAWLCLPRAPANRGCRLLMEHSGFRRCQLQIEQPSGKQIQVPGGRSDSPLIC